MVPRWAPLNHNPLIEKWQYTEQLFANIDNNINFGTLGRQPLIKPIK